MSSGALHSMAEGQEADGGSHVKWFPPTSRPGEEAASDEAGSLHLRVELPSRRWYIEAVGQPGIAR